MTLGVSPVALSILRNLNLFSRSPVSTQGLNMLTTPPRQASQLGGVGSWLATEAPCR